MAQSRVFFQGLKAAGLSGILLQPTESFSPVPATEATGITAPGPSQPFPAKEETLAEPLTLERSLEIALKNNPEVAATGTKPFARPQIH